MPSCRWAKQSGPLMQSISRAQQRASQIAPAVPEDLGGFCRKIRTQLYEGATALRDAERVLGDFDIRAASFAEGLLRGAAGSRPTSARGTTRSDSWLSPFGLSMVDVASLDLSDNPILGDFGRGDLHRSDYEWLVSTWSETVGPGVASGMCRDDFAVMDARSGAAAGRRTVDVFDIFLTSDPIHLSHRPDGSIDIGGGRHRISIAKALGIRSLPARFH